MNLTELQILQQKIAGMTGSEFENWYYASYNTPDESYEFGYNDGYSKGYDSAKDEYDPI